MVLQPNLLLFLKGFCCTHSGAIFVAFLLRHHLAAVDLFLLLRLGLLGVGCQCESGRQKHGGNQCGHHKRLFHMRELLIESGWGMGNRKHCNPFSGSRHLPEKSIKPAENSLSIDSRALNTSP